MNYLKTLSAFLTMSFYILATGCSEGGLETVRVDSHVFHVPAKYLVRGSIPWLAENHSKGLMFVANPDAPLQEQLIVTVESTAKTCNPKSQPVSVQLRSACLAAAQKGVSVAKEQGITLERVNRNGDATQWEYRVVNSATGGGDQVVASCYALSEDGTSGLCTALGEYNDLVYVVDVRDADVKNIREIHANIYNILESWDQNPGG